MAPWSLVSLLFCHLIVLTAGQHLGVRKCSNECNKMTSPIPVERLISYQQNEESCPKRAIILKTRQHRTFCADPKEKWVQEVMQHLDHRAAALTRNGGMFEKQISMVKPGTILTTRGPSLPEPKATEPKATVESLEVTVSPQEARRPLETSPEVPVAVTEPLETGFPPTSTSRAGDAGPAAAPEATEAVKAAAMSTAIVWQSSASYQPEAGPWAEETATEAPSTTVPSTQAPTTSHPAPEEKVGPEGPPARVQGQSPSPENSVGPEMSTASTDALQTQGSGSVTHPSAAPVPSEGTPGWELLSSGSWPPAATEPVHAVDSQKQSVLITPVPDSQAATRRQAVGLLAFLGLLFCLGVAMFAYQSLQGCPRKMAGEMVEGLRYVPRSCGSNSYVLVPV